MAPDNKYVEFLKEQLELSGVPLDEAPADDELDDVEKDVPEEEPEIEKPKEDEPDEPKDKREKKDDKPETELADTWDIEIKTAGKLKFELHENYIYVWYRDRKSNKIELPGRLRVVSKQMSELFNKVLSHVEKVS